nr:Ty3/gypsy retrotransposon protein [Tanacetum cinerariifolium]
MVDRLMKYAYFMVLGHPFSAKDVAQVFLDNIYKLHGCPNSIISDRDLIFLSSFWTEFLKLQGVSAKLSTAYHPQTDGQTEVVNRCLEGYLRCMVMERPYTWIKWMSLAEWDVADQDVDEMMQDQEAAIKVLKQSLIKAQNCRGPPSKIVSILKEARFSLQPSAVLDQKLVKRRNRIAMKVLVQWKGQTTQDATWEFLDELKLRFPDFSELTSCGQEVG